MAYEIPWTEPESVAVGDRIQWKRNLPDFPATSGGWTLTYYLRANLPGGQIDITASADEDDFEVDISPTVSGAWTPGTYFWQAFVSKSGDRKPIRESKLVISPNFADVSLPSDFRTHARRTYDSICLVIEGRATRDEQRYVMQSVGRSLDRMPIRDLVWFKDYYWSLVRAEEEAEKVEQGKGTGRNVLVRFS